MNQRRFITALVVVLALAGVIGPATASTTSVDFPANDSTNATATSVQEPIVGAIDSRTRIVSYDHSGDQITVVVESDVYQELVIYDKFAGATTSGGFSKVPDGARKEVQIPKGRTEVTVDLTSKSGVAAVDISTSRNGGSIWVQTSAIVFTTAASWGDVQAVAMIVPFGGLWAAFVVGNRIRDNKTPSTERKN